MRDYEGPATVTVKAHQLDVQVRLFFVETPGELGKWEGQIRTENPGALWDVWLSDKAQLRIGDKVGEFFIVHYGEPGWSDVRGTGPPPF